MILPATNWCPRVTPGRIIYSSYDLFCTILLGVYTARLIALLTVRKTTLPFNTFEEFLQNENYKVGAVGGTLLATTLLDNVSLKNLKEYYPAFFITNKAC